MPSPDGYFDVATSTGNDAAAIQAAINAAQSAGGGTVWLANRSWACSSGITFDPTLVSLEGASATLDFSSAGDINFISITQTPAGNYDTPYRQWLRGVAIYGPAKGTGTALYFYSPSGLNQAASLQVENVTIARVKYGVVISDNAYLTRFESVAIGSASVCVKRLGSENNGENVTFVACVLGNSDTAFHIPGPRADFRFFGCSFDYSGEIGYTDSQIEFHGCHFESNVTSGNRQFQADNGGRMSFFGGEIGLVTSNPPDYLFTSYPTNGGGLYVLHNVAISDFHNQQFSTTLANDPNKIVIIPPEVNGNAISSYGSTFSPTLRFSRGFSGALTSNLLVTKPLDANRNPAPLVLSFKQAATGGPCTVAFSPDYVFRAGAPVMPATASATMTVSFIYDPMSDKYYGTVL